jgi:uncharacterized protein (DUF486 family)
LKEEKAMSYNYPMNDQLTYQEAYREARRTVNAKIGFFFSLFTYAIVNTLLFVIWLNSQNTTAIDFDNVFHVRNTSSPWFLWVLIPWGIGLVFHFLRAFVYTGRNRQQMIVAEMKRMGLEQQPTIYYPTQTAEYQEQK